jgi:hypothetical protein
MKKQIFFQAAIIAFLFLLFTGRNNCLQAQAAVPDSSKKSFKLFEDDKMIEITLRFDLTTYFRTKPKEDYLKANLTFNLSKTDSISRDINLRTRGIFRNRECTFPPIELNLKKAKFGYTDLDKISKLKLVPECSSGSDNINFVVKEYLAYKLFNVLTDTSFRVRLLSITYLDTQKKRKPIKQVGFFIEPAEMMAARINCAEVKSRTLNQKNIVPRIMDRIAIFNFMIGNYDWSVPGLHNIYVLKTRALDTTGLGIAVPHDFDWSGLVNPPYALPTEETEIQSVRERKFIGICRSKEVYLKDLEPFVQKKNEFYRIINEFPYINQREKKDATDYLDGFFNQLVGKKDMLIYNFTNTCKNF